MNLFPYTNFHDLNLDWLLQQLRKAVFKVNGTAPDEDGNVNLPTVAGVSSVNGIGADGQGNVNVTLAQLGGVALNGSVQTSINPVSDLNQFFHGLAMFNAYGGQVSNSPPIVSNTAANWWVVIAVSGYVQIAFPAGDRTRPRYIRGAGPDPQQPTQLLWSEWTIYNPIATDPYLE